MEAECISDATLNQAAEDYLQKLKMFDLENIFMRKKEHNSKGGKANCFF